MLRHLDSRLVRHPLRTPFRISRGVKLSTDVVMVTITDGDHAGHGEAVPYDRYGETPDGALAVIAGVAELIAKGGNRMALAAALPAGPARNALDCALWDMEARIAGRSVSALLGRSAPRPIASAITIGIDTPERMAAVSGALASVPVLKVKVDATAPEAQIAAVRSAAPAPRLIVDPNESWTIAHLARLEGFLVDHRVDLLEQPLPADADTVLDARAFPIAICADESVHVAADLDRLEGHYSHVNIKLDKTGGLTEALTLEAEARRRGFGVMIGCMVTSSLGIAPALQLADEADFVDLDGPLWLAADLPGGVSDHDGMLAPPAPGFWGEL